MLMNERVAVFVISIIAGAGVAVGDWPLDPTGPARKVSIGSRELVWTNTYAIIRDRYTANVEVIAEDSTSFQTWANGSTTGQRSDFTMESIVGPFVCFSISSEGSDGRGSTKRWVKHLGSDYPDAGDIRGLFDEIDIIEALGREFGIEFTDEQLQPGSLFHILGTNDLLPCNIRRGLIDQWSVSEIGETTATISVMSEFCPRGSSPSSITIPIPETKRYYFDEARRLRTTWSDLVPLAGPPNVSWYLRDLPHPWTVPWVPPATEYQEARMIHDGVETPVRWNNRGMELLNDGTDDQWTTVFRYQCSTTDYGWSRDAFSTTDRQLAAIVGPLATYREVHRSSDRRGSRVTVQFRTVDTEHPESGFVPINRVFEDREVIQALAQSEVVAPHMGDLTSKTLRELEFRGDDCGIFKNLTGSWSILRCVKGRATVRITLPATDEFCGDYHETFDIEVPVKSEWLEYVQAAEADGFLGVQLYNWHRRSESQRVPPGH
ncbi:MAG: hypothetical protein PVG53_13490 [Holophagae bacterium]